VPFTYPGVVPVSFPAGVAGAAAPLFTAFLNELVPTINGGMKVGECWGFSNKQNTNSPGKWSFHAYGLALDINAPSNPNGSSNMGKAPGKYQLPPETEGLARKYGLLWLGDSDPMHVECHLAPDEIPNYVSGAGIVTGAVQSVGTGVTSQVGGLDKRGLIIAGGVAVVGAIIAIGGGLSG
jgi:hypothetical protein